MPQNYCNIENCTKPRVGWGLCSLHYQRWKKRGDPNVTEAPRHGLVKTPEYQAWIEMKRRCTVKHRVSWKDWGGRGISYDPSWKIFMQFLTDMGPKPSPKHQLDRIDNMQGYSKRNCRWATPKEQSNNKRNNHFVTINGVTKTIQQWCDEYVIPDTTVHNRLSRGWDEVKAITTPSGNLTKRI